MNIKPINTEFQGYNFRSRLEARWAVFFSTLGWDYMYEPAGFVLPSGEKYLPDFYLPKLRVWVEVKVDFLEIFDFKRATELVKGTRVPLLILDSDPSYKMHSMIVPDNSADGYKVVDVNLIVNQGAFEENLMLMCEQDYISAGQTESITAIKRARAHRFGVYESQN